MGCRELDVTGDVLDAYFFLHVEKFAVTWQGGVDSIPGQRTKILHDKQAKKKKKEQDLHRCPWRERIGQSSERDVSCLVVSLWHGQEARSHKRSILAGSGPRLILMSSVIPCQIRYICLLQALPYGSWQDLATWTLALSAR